ncbi:hypothetical protein, partial [Staphylococcus epidermidis]|uniref:hypothetical protein n=1 Tax=Staphylococcus epidermidis TaxID=1282 RepID=UPI0027385A2D
YDLRAARGRYEDALPAIRNELASAGPEAARRKLLAALVGDGSADQLLKALVKRELEKSLAGKPLPDGLAAKLTEKAAIDRALPAEKLGALRPLLTASVLQPVLVEGRALDSSDVLRALRAVRAQALELVLADPG